MTTASASTPNTHRSSLRRSSVYTLPKNIQERVLGWQFAAGSFRRKGAVSGRNHSPAKEQPSFLHFLSRAGSRPNTHRRLIRLAKLIPLLLPAHRPAYSGSNKAGDGSLAEQTYRVEYEGAFCKWSNQVGEQAGDYRLMRRISRAPLRQGRPGSPPRNTGRRGGVPQAKDVSAMELATVRDLHFTAFCRRRLARSDDGCKERRATNRTDV